MISEVKNPLILFGVGRCGSTLVHQLLAKHPRLAWISGFANYFPEWPWLNSAAMRVIDLPGDRRHFQALDQAERTL